jgi:hypothetical protein
MVLQKEVLERGGGQGSKLDYKWASKEFFLTKIAKLNLVGLPPEKAL